jgi:hypothetical protein
MKEIRIRAAHANRIASGAWNNSWRNRLLSGAGYEANGFLLGLQHLARLAIAPLMTRDSVLPMVAPLAAVAQASAQLIATLPDHLPPPIVHLDAKIGRVRASLIG